VDDAVVDLYLFQGDALLVNPWHDRHAETLKPEA
jgi:hypothetical protein